MKTPCDKCLTKMICRNHVKTIEGNIDFEASTTENSMMNVLIDISLFDICPMLKDYLKDDDYMLDYPRTKLIMESLNL